MSDNLVTPEHHRPDRAPGFRAIRWNNDWILRPLMGVGMAIVALGGAAMEPKVLAGLILLLLIAAGREWHRLVSQNRLEPVRLHLLTAVTVASAAASLAMFLSGLVLWAVLPLLVGAGVAYLLAQQVNPLWQAAGVVYLGLPALALVALRSEPRGALMVMGLFFIVWATDTGALVFGNLIGGPRLAPRLSPGKTWAGTIGGSVTAALVYGFFVTVIDGSFEWSMIFAFLFSIVAHGGDLLESFCKRRFGVKDTGTAIPGHGGILDRIDSTLAASVALALLVFLFHLDPLFRGIL